MTDAEVKAGWNDVWLNFWNKFKDSPPQDESGWAKFHDGSKQMKKDYPLLEGAVNRMVTEITERARGRGNRPGEFHGMYQGTNIKK